MICWKCASPPAPAPQAAEGEAEPEGPERRNPARYLWAILLARIYEAFPLTCTHCGSEMRIIAFVTEGAEVRKILEHVGEPSTPPRIAPARGPPEWAGDGGIEQDNPFYDAAVAQAEPEYEFNQRVSW